MTTRQPETPLGTFGRIRTDCAELVAEANRFLAAHGGRPVEFPPPEKLRLALLGQYNAGKSTLLNALLGRRAAMTGDSPETRKVTPYDWRDYHVVDLPGTDARLPDQAEALRAIQSAHAVLYVVSSQTGLDYATFWNDLKYLSGHHIPFLLVVNDKQPHEDEAEEHSCREEMVGAFRRKAAAVLGPDHAVTAYWVNARRAEVGRADGRPALVASSGVFVLENALIDYLSRTDPLLRELTRLADLELALEQVRHRAAAEATDAGDRRIVEALERFEAARERLAGIAHGIAAERFANLRDVVAARMGGVVAAADPARAAAAADVTKTIRSTFDEAVASFCERAGVELEALRGLPGADVPVLERIDSDLALRLGGLPRVADGAGADTAKRIGTAAAAAIPVMQRLAATSRAAAGAAGAARGAGQAGTALARGAAEAETAIARTGGSVAGGAARWLGPVVAVAMVAWEIHRGFKEAEREREAYAMALREANAKAVLAAGMTRDAFLGRTLRAIERAFAPALVQLRQELERRSVRKNDANGRAAEATDLHRRVTAMRAEVESRTRGATDPP